MSLINLDTVSLLEDIILQNKNGFFPDLKTRENIQRKLIIEAFQFHVSNNDVYRAYCEKRAVTLDDVINDIRNIPLIPSTIFKKMSIRTNSNEKTVKYCESSGTQGSVSIIERDAATLERFVGTIDNTNKNVFNLKDCIVLGLTPPPIQAKDLWIAYVISLYNRFFPAEYYVHNGVLKAQELIRDLNRYKDEYDEICLIGPPIMYVHVLKYLKDNNLKLDFGDKIFMITGGGWKRFEGQAISRLEFKNQCKEYFIGLKDDRIRDVFNMTELNTLIPECEAGSKHVPVWLDVFPIDLETYKVANTGEIGLLGFLDATPTSYPGFVVSGDVGRITHVDNCPCGRDGVCIEVLRRINTVESRGCAMKIEKTYSSPIFGGAIC